MIEEPLLTCKELAMRLRRSVTYVYAMRKAGFLMPADRATLSRALGWLARNPRPRKRAEQHGRPRKNG